MANLLKMAIVETILTLRRRGWSQRRIARELDLNRETVARHLRQAQSATSTPADSAADQPKPASAPLGSGAPPAEPKPASAPLGSGPAAADAPDPNPPTTGALSRRPSDAEPWRAVIRAKLELGLSAQRIFQDLRADHGCTVSYYSVRRFVRRLQPRAAELPFRRLECQPGEEAQVDFGTGAPIVTPDGTRRRTHVFRMVLSYSRKAYSEVVYRQTADEFLRCLENGFRHF